MPFKPNALRRLAFVVPLLLAVPPPVGATPVRKDGPRATATTRVATDGGIIALPLNPVVPAAQRACTALTPSGLGYTMLRPATGAKPASGDVVLINYIGYLAATGAVFDQGQHAPLEVSGVIPGFAQALQMMARTGIARFCIPAALGYGVQGGGPIPANADLVFQIELIDFRPAADPASPPPAQADSAAPPDATAPH